MGFLLLILALVVLAELAVFLFGVDSRLESDRRSITHRFS
jgi:hypothetical protein